MNMDSTGLSLEAQLHEEKSVLKMIEEISLTPFPLKKYTFRLRQKCVLKF